MPVIMGHNIPAKTLWIGGGLIAAAVAVVVWLRSRAAASAAPDQTAAQPDPGSMSVPAPTQAIADQYQQQMDNSQLQAQNIANSYQQQLATQQQSQFDFQQQQAAALAPYMQQEQQSQLAVQTHYNDTVANTRISCPGGQGVAADPATGQLYCRQKTSGSVLGIPLGDIARTVQGFIGGVEAAAPSIGYGAAQQAAAYELGQVFPKSIPGVTQAQSPASAPRAPQTALSPVTGTPQLNMAQVAKAPHHGYQEIS